VVYALEYYFNMVYQVRLYFLVFAFGGFGLVSFIPDFIGLDSRLVTISYRMIIFLISVLLIFLAIANSRNKLVVKVVSLLSMSLMAAYLFRLAGDGQFIFGRSLAEIMILAVGVSFIPSIALSTVKNNSVILNALNLLIVCFVLISFLAVCNGFIKGYSYRLSGNSILNPITLGHFATSGIILIAIRWLSQDARVSRFDTIWLTTALMISLLALLMAGSRGPILGLSLTLAYYFHSKFSYFLRQKVVGIVAMSILVVVVAFSFDQILDTFSNRMVIDFGDDGQGGEARVVLWATGIDIFLQNPWFGNQTTTIIGYPHNIVIEILMASGIVGGIVFFAIMAHAFRKVHRLNKSGSMLVWPGLLFCQHFVGSLFSGTLYSSNDLWYSLALLLAVNLDWSTKSLGNNVKL